MVDGLRNRQAVTTRPDPELESLVYRRISSFRAIVSFVRKSVGFVKPSAQIHLLAPKGAKRHDFRFRAPKLTSTNRAVMNLFLPGLFAGSAAGIHGRGLSSRRFWIGVIVAHCFVDFFEDLILRPEKIQFANLLDENQESPLQVFFAWPWRSQGNPTNHFRWRAVTSFRFQTILFLQFLTFLWQPVSVAGLRRPRCSHPNLCRHRVP